MTHEVVDGYQYIDARLRANSSLMALIPGGIWRDVAPTTTQTPYVVIGFQAGIDVNTANGIRVMTDTQFQARVSAPRSLSSKTGQAAALVDQILRQRVMINGNTISCHRESPLFYGEVVSGDTWDHLGGIYSLLIEPS